jgi:hypothetical protein
MATRTMPKTNAQSFSPNLRGKRRADLLVRAGRLFRRLRRHVLHREVDDFDWTTYHQFYGPENEVEARNYTYDLSEVDHLVRDGRLFTVGDAKPINPPHMALFEAVLGLPNVTSVHEVGAGAGKLIVNLGMLLDPAIKLGASDVGAGQLELFERTWPAGYRKIAPFQHDIAAAPLPDRACADVVYTSTVLMHIKRQSAYMSALRNLLHSARRHIVLVENWAVHDYAADLREAALTVKPGQNLSLRCYDSGAAVALVASFGGAPLPERYATVAVGARVGLKK